MYEDSKGNLLVGTNNGGLHIMDKAGSRIQPFSADPNEFGTICSITGDDKGRLWVGTSNGLFSIDAATGL